MVKTAEQANRPKFCAGPYISYITPGKVYGWSKFQKLASNKIQLSLNFANPQNFLFYNVHHLKEKMFTIEIADGREAFSLKSVYVCLYPI